MKKLIALLAIICLTSFKADNEKVYTLKLTEKQLNALWYALDKSTAEHITVKELQAVISQQVSDTTKQK